MQHFRGNDPLLWMRQVGHMLIRWFCDDYTVRNNDSLCYSIRIQPELHSFEELYVYAAEMRNQAWV